MSAEQLLARITLLRDNLAALDRVPQATFEEFMADYRNLDYVLHKLQTSIQVLIDIGSTKLAILGLGVPATSREILVKLERAGHLPERSEGRFGPLFGFRNRVVHLYDRIDPQIVYRILRENRADLEQLADLLLAIPDRP